MDERPQISESACFLCGCSSTGMMMFSLNRWVCELCQFPGGWLEKYRAAPNTQKKAAIRTAALRAAAVAPAGVRGRT